MTNTSLPKFNIQETIENLLRATGREHVDQLLTIMRDYGYYSVGCHGHHRWRGGLAQHSLEVLLRMQRLNESSKVELPISSVVIVALLHDLCDIRAFKQYHRHGSRSVLIATREAEFKLYPMEYQAILWHMHGAKEKGKLGAQFDEVLDNPLWKLLRQADHYSASNPLTMNELQHAMSGKPRQRKSSDVVVRSSGHSLMSPKQCAEKVPAPKRELTDEEKRTQRIRRNNSSYQDLMNALEELNMDRNEAIELLLQAEVQRTRGPIVNNPHYKGFNKEYLRTASYEEIENHRTLLMDRCQYEKCAAKFAASYIYSDTKGVFNRDLETKDMYNWLKEEFNTTASLDMFYKARPMFDTNRR